QPAAPAVAADHRDRGFADPFQAIRHALDALLVGEGVLRGPERLELRNVGPGHERLISRAGQDDRADLVGAVDAFAVVQQAVIHVPGQRVACARAVEGHERQRTILPEENLILTLSAHRGSPRSPVLNRGWFPPSLSLFVFSFWCT